MGFISAVRRMLGISGVDDGGVASSLRNVGQIDTYGAAIQPTVLDEPPAPASTTADLPWELRDDEGPTRQSR